MRPSAATRLVSLVAAVLAVQLFLGHAPAAAHTDLDFTVPTDGAAVGEPVREITVGFTDAVTLVGPGFEVLDPQGRTLTPFAVTDDDRVFRLQLDPPIGGGEAAVRYEVRAEDGHVISGGFRFTISVEAPTTTTVAPTTAPPATVAATVVPATSAEASSTTSADTSSTISADTSSATTVAVTAAPSDDGGSNTGAYLAVIVVVAVAAVGALVVRARGLRSG